MTILTVLKVRHSFFVAIYSNEYSDENICTYDYIGADLPVYFFEKFDRQNCLQFGDEAYSIIFNTDEWRRRHMTLQELMDRNYEQGLEKGRTEGELEAVRRLARNFKNAGISAEIIAENTGLSLEEIEKL